MNIEAYDADSLRKMVRLLEYENKILKDKLKKAGISYEEVNPFEEKIESAEEYDLDQGSRIVNPPYITEKMAIRFFSMFWGREDVYARRGKNGGYFPQCANRWNDRLCPKQRKEKVFCDECENTKWISLDVKKIIAHLLGTKEDGSDVIGVYPLLPNGTCRFIVFDFDNHEKGAEVTDFANTDNEWHKEVDALRKMCELNGIRPLCGSGMYGNVNRKKKKDGTLYKDYFYYACKHRRLVDGHKCGYRKQWSEEKINNAVEEVIRKLVKNPKFEEAILNKIGSRIDTEEIEKEIERLEKQHRQLTGAKARLGQQMDSLDIMDKFYEKKYQDMETRLYRLYDEIEGVENSIEEVKNRLLNIRQQKISEENVYQFLLYFDKLYDKFTDLEKKEFLNSFVEQVDIYEQEQPDGRFLKHIKFRFPVYFGDREIQELCWDNESTVETVCLLGKRKPDAKVKIGIDMDDYYRIRENAESK